jgi:adenylate kinase
MNIIFLGPIASGKGTQSQIISSKYNLKAISIGELLRERRNIEDEIGLKIASLQQQGVLVDDDITLQVLEEKVKTCKKDEGILFDGYPRTIHQAHMLDELLKKYGRKIDKVINLEIDDNSIVDRIGGRLVCKCGETYHLTHKKPVKENICDKCGDSLYQRDDDTETGIKKRLEVYHTYVKPLIGFYEDKNLLANVNALQSIEAISNDIEKIVGGIK